MKHRWIALVLCLWVPLALVAQTRLIYLEHANTLSFDKKANQERQVLKGDVLFRQDSIWMACDSAYFYQSSNSFEAFSHVHMYEGDTLEMWCDSLAYNGNTMIGELFDHVRLRHNDTHLHTEYLVYNRAESEAHYPYGGWIADPENHLKSDLGWYYPNSKQAKFRNQVEMRAYDFSDMPAGSRPTYPDPTNEQQTPEAVLYSDTLNYSFATALAEVRGESRIETDTATLYTTLGTMNSRTQQSWLYEKSVAISPGRRTTADTLFYDGKLEYGEGWGHFVAHDSLQHLRIQGEYAHYTRMPQTMTVTREALAMEFSEKDTLYMHADTIRAYTTEADSVNHLACFYNVRYYRPDLQGVCDSLHYNHRDSVATFIGNPVMWNGQYQITGDTIFAYMSNTKGIDRVLIHDQASLIQQHDSIHYDQISGKELICYFDSSRVRQMDMSGNVQTIFYPEDGKGDAKQLIGLNQVIGSYLTIWFVNQKMDHLRIWPQPIGSMTPIHLVTKDILYLDGFRWMNYLRPVDAKDVFRDIRMKEEDKVEVVRLFDDAELNGW